MKKNCLIVVKKRKLNKDLIAKAKDLSSTDWMFIALKQEQILKREVKINSAEFPRVLELDEWE